MYLSIYGAGRMDNIFNLIPILWRLKQVLSEDDHSYWAPPYWNVTKETFSFGRTKL